MTAINCGPIVPIERVFLAYPAPGATGVPDGVGTLVVGEIGITSFDSNTLTLTTTAAGVLTKVAQATPGPAPSPLPSPLATNQFSGNPSYFSFPVPTLSPGTTYSGYYDYGYAPPPPCSSAAMQYLGSFTAQ